MCGGIFCASYGVTIIRYLTLLSLEAQSPVLVRIHSKDLRPYIKDRVDFWLHLRQHSQHEFPLRAKSLSSRWHKRNGILRLKELLQNQGICVVLLLNIEVFLAERQNDSRVVCITRLSDGF